MEATYNQTEPGNVFNWKDYNNSILVSASEQQRVSKEDNRKYRNRDWSAEYKKRLKAGTANRIKSI